MWKLTVTRSVHIPCREVDASVGMWVPSSFDIGPFVHGSNFEAESWHDNTKYRHSQ
jgi:hypothetical protein